MPKGYDNNSSQIPRAKRLSTVKQLTEYHEYYVLSFFIHTEFCSLSLLMMFPMPYQIVHS